MIDTTNTQKVLFDGRELTGAELIDLGFEKIPTESIFFRYLGIVYHLRQFSTCFDEKMPGWKGWYDCPIAGTRIFIGAVKWGSIVCGREVDPIRKRCGVSFVKRSDYQV